MTDASSSNSTPNSNPMHGNVSESDIINAINQALSKFEETDDISLDLYYNTIFKLHMDIFPQNTPAKLILDNMATTQFSIKSSPNSRLYSLGMHDLYECIIMMVLLKIIKKTGQKVEPIKKAIKDAWLKFLNKIDEFDS